MHTAQKIDISEITIANRGAEPVALAVKASALDDEILSTQCRLMILRGIKRHAGLDQSTRTGTMTRVLEEERSVSNAAWIDWSVKAGSVMATALGADQTATIRLLAKVVFAQIEEINPPNISTDNASS